MLLICALSYPQCSFCFSCLQTLHLPEIRTPFLFFLQFNSMDMASSSSSTPNHNQTQQENAFAELAPYSYPASKSTQPWNIFINHCGRDVKHTLATSIYNKLHFMGFHVFLDLEALEPGDSFPAELQHAISTATLHFAIFSPNYAHSPWCLGELSFMLKSGAKIIPIFYYVDPSDLRWFDQGKGKYASAFSEHEEKGRYTPEKLDEWKSALRQVSSLHGYTISNNKDEATVLKNVVNFSLQIMKKAPLWVAEHPLGLDELVKAFESAATEEGVKMKGIVGMGGSGKTTLAKELYNRNFPSFERCSFVFDVRDAASRNALCDKQKKLLSDLGLHHSPFDHVDEGKAILENRLTAHQALIVLDDVDHIDQLNALLPKKEKLGSQSMVIVTTRDLGVLISWGLDCIYHIPGLANPHAKQLFCWHAFLQPSPPADFETLVQDFLRACNGLPLSLKVLGAQLYGRKSKDYWKSQLSKILRILPGEIKERLQVSYYALDEEEREMFLDVACLFIGKDENKVIATWDGSGWSGLQGLETLVSKCLVELVEKKDVEYEGNRIKRIRMHDHLRDMGREIASRHSPFRLWSPEQIDNMKKHSMKRKQIRGITPADAFVAFKEYTHRLMGNSSTRSKRLRFSNELQILSVEGNEFTEEFASLTEDLVWLRWKGFLLRNLPLWLPLKNLRILELHEAYELEELWQDNANPPLQLRELIVRQCSKLQSLPISIGRLQHLKRLDTHFHGSSLSEELCGLQSLERLQLSAPLISSLPAGFGNLTSLRNINMQSSEQLSALPNSFTQLIHLEVLNLSYCEMLSSLPACFGNLTRLRDICMQNCKQLSMLPDSFSKLTQLKKLKLGWCGKLSSLPVGFVNLLNLREIDVSGCEQLSCLPYSLEQLIHLQTFEVGSQRLVEIETLPLSLKVLRIKSCNSLKNIRCISGLINLEELEIHDCVQIEELPSLPLSLKVLRIKSCNSLKNIRCISGLINLEELQILHCVQIEELPSFEHLASLRTFQMRNCPKVEKIQGLEHAKSLKTLIVVTNWRVPGIQSLENAERLEKLCMKCESISAVKPCIQSIKGKEPPTLVWIRGGVEEDCIVKCMEFGDVAVTEVEKPSDEWTLAWHVPEKEGNDVERKEVDIICTKYGQVYGFREKAVVGERGRVVESFYGLLELLE